MNIETNVVLFAVQMPQTLRAHAEMESLANATASLCLDTNDCEELVHSPTEMLNTTGPPGGVVDSVINTNGIIESVNASAQPSVPEADVALAWNEEEIEDGPHTAFIAEICGTESQMAPTLRVVLDSNQDEEFVEALYLYIAKLDSHIERICHHHYVEFIDSVREMLQVRHDSYQLKDDILSCGYELQHTGNKVLNGYGELVKLRVIQRNIAQSIEALNACLPVLNTYKKVIDQLKKKNYYKALRALEHLEIALPKLEGLSIAKLLACNIPVVRARIKQEVRSDLQDWLESVLKHASHLGAAMMLETAKEAATYDIESYLHLFSLPVAEGQEGATTDTKTESSKTGSSSAVIDYRPMYRCLHIYSVLGVSEEFESFYIDSRKKQAVLVLEASGQAMGISGNSFRRIRNYFCQVLGFFIVEDVVMNTTAGLVSASNIDDLWKMGLDRIGATLHKELVVCEDKAVLMQLKRFVSVFCMTLDSYGYNVAQLYDLLLSVRDRYDQLLMDEWEIRFDEILKEDDLQRVVVDNQAEWDIMVEELGFSGVNQAFHDTNNAFPRTLAISSGVIGLYNCIEEFYQASLSFLLDLNLSHTQLDEMIRVSGSRLISERLKLALFKAIQKQIDCINITGLMQCRTNSELLGPILGNLDNAIAKLTNTTTTHSFASTDVDEGAGLSDAVVVTLKASSNYAVDGISEILRTLINTKFDASKYDWITSSPRDVPSAYLQSMVQDLTPILASSQDLTNDVIHACSFAATQHIAGRFMSLITGLDFDQKTNTIQKRTKAPIPMRFKIFKTLALDVQLLKGFADSTEVAHVCDLYTEAYQLIELFKSAALDDYLSQEKRRLKFGSVKKRFVEAVVERMLATPQGNIQHSFAPNEQRKRNLWLYLQELKSMRL
eukprot:CFRG4469T1